MSAIPHTIIVVSSCVTLMCIVYIVAGWCDRYGRKLTKRLHSELDGAANGVSDQRVPGRNWLSWLLPANVSQKLNAHHGTPESRALAMAGYRSPVAPIVYLAARAACSALPLMLAWAIVVFTGYNPEQVVPWCAIAACLGFFGPKLWLNRAIVRRHSVLCRTLPDFLDLLNVCLDSGLSVQGSLQRLASEINLVHRDLAAELAIVQRDIEFGATIDAAFARFAERTGYDAIRTFSALIRESRRLGTPLGQAMKTLAEMLRSQREQAAEEYAQKAAVRILLPVMLLIFPAIFVVVAGPAVIEIMDAFAPQ